jgi:hypothetical protein
MKSFTCMIRSKVWPLNAPKMAGEFGSKARSEMQVLECRHLHRVVGGDEMDAPKGSWLASRTASAA